MLVSTGAWGVQWTPQTYGRSDIFTVSWTIAHSPRRWVYARSLCELEGQWEPLSHVEYVTTWAVVIHCPMCDASSVVPGINIHSYRTWALGCHKQTGSNVQVSSALDIHIYRCCHHVQQTVTFPLGSQMSSGVKIILSGYWIRRALASAHILCPFPEYCPIFQGYRGNGSRGPDIQYIDILRSSGYRKSK
jgi:hypothetical protein